MTSTLLIYHTKQKCMITIEQEFHLSQMDFVIFSCIIYLFYDIIVLGSDLEKTVQRVLLRKNPSIGTDRTSQFVAFKR